MSDSTHSTPAKKAVPATPPRGLRPFVGRTAEQGIGEPSSAAPAPRRLNAPFKPFAGGPAVPASVTVALTVSAEPLPDDSRAEAASPLEMEIAAAFEADAFEPPSPPDAGEPPTASDIVTEAAVAHTDEEAVRASSAAVAFASTFESVDPAPEASDPPLPDIRDFGYDSDFLTEEPLLGLTAGMTAAEPIDEVEAAFIATGSTSLPEGSPNALLAAETLESIARRLRMGALEVTVNSAMDLSREESALAAVLAALLSRR